jgi:hypothetical protein
MKKVTPLSMDENISLMSVRMMYARKKNSKRLCMHCDQQERTHQKLENILIVGYVKNYGVKQKMSLSS